MEFKTVEVEFSKSAGPVHFINVFGVNRGTDDYFIQLGSVVPPDLPREDVEKIEKLEVKPIFVCAVTKGSMKQFIELLQREYC